MLVEGPYTLEDFIIYIHFGLAHRLLLCVSLDLAILQSKGVLVLHLITHLGRQELSGLFGVNLSGLSTSNVNVKIKLYPNSPWSRICPI